MRRPASAAARRGALLGTAAAWLLSLVLHGAALAFLARFRAEPPAPASLALVELVTEAPALPGAASGAGEGVETAGGPGREAVPADPGALPAAPVEAVAAPAPKEPERAATAPSTREAATRPSPRPASSRPARAEKRERAGVVPAAPGAGGTDGSASSGRGAEGGGATDSNGRGAAGEGGGSGDGGEGEPPGFALGSLANPLPHYPAAARRRGIEGTVVLEVAVSPAGLPEEVVVARSSGSRLLDEAALEAVRRWRFRPARRAGEPVAGRVAVPITFRLLEPLRASMP
ncbi:MAG: TonB family protein [Geminicoccaceae bacterium]|nr:TonB family protein [Geminicoccaceae bacterium]